MRRISGGLRLLLWLPALSLLTAATTLAQPTIHRGASLLVFPRIVVDASVDTVLQVANISNSRIHARCFFASSSANTVTTTSFDLTMVKQQPLHWQVSAGKSFDVLLPGFPPTVQPVTIPALAAPFRGELRCVEVDEIGELLYGNHLVGSAVIKDTQSHDVAGYNAIGLPANPETYNPSDSILLDGSDNYASCPQTWSSNHHSAAVGLTIVPCSENLAAGTIASVDVFFAVTNESAVTLTASTTISGWTELLLSDLDPDGPAYSSMDRDAIGTDYARTTITSMGGGILVVAEERVSAAASASATLSNLWAAGQQAVPDTIVLPSLP